MTLLLIDNLDQRFERYLEAMISLKIRSGFRLKWV